MAYKEKLHLVLRLKFTANSGSWMLWYLHKGCSQCIIQGGKTQMYNAILTVYLLFTLWNGVGEGHQTT